MASRLLGRMAKVATECVEHPRRPSFWIDVEGRYVCPTEYPRRTPAAELTLPIHASEVMRIEPKFKLVFLTSVVGTLLFTLICVGLHLATTGEPPPLREKLVDNFFTMAKVGFGAIVGLLEGKAL